MSENRIKILNQLLSHIEQNIPNKALKKPSVSSSDIGWQLDHTLKVFNAVSLWTVNSNPKEFKRKFNMWRSILLPLGYFPRGKVKAPKHVLPPEIIKTEDLKSQLQTARTHTENLKTLPKKAIPTTNTYLFFTNTQSSNIIIKEITASAFELMG